MNPMATSKENILQISRKLIQQNGWAGVNIRSVAAACGVSVGCISNYFESKTDLLSATVESIWSDIFHHPEDEAVFLDALCTVLRNDTRIRADAFTAEFTVEKFAEMLFSLMLSALVRQDFDPSTVLEIVRRAVY